MVTNIRSGAICMVGGSILVGRPGMVGNMDGRLDDSRADNTDNIRAGFDCPS